jgi:hypothetical protein
VNYTVRRLFVFFVRQSLESLAWHGGQALGRHFRDVLRERAKESRAKAPRVNRRKAHTKKRKP